MLSKGPTFCFPFNPNFKTYIYFINEFIRKIHWNYILNKHTYNSRNRFGIHKTYNWPNIDLINIDLKRLCNKIFNSSLNILKNNFTNSAASNYSNLFDKNNCIITTADKGNNWVIMNKSCYIKEGLDQLNTNFYAKINKPRCNHNLAAINRFINYMFNKKIITLNEKRFLLTDKNFHKRNLYLLPKIHKSYWSVPNIQPKGRPIINCKNSETHKIAIFIDHFLQPIVKASNSYIRDSFNFIAKISNLNINNNSFLVSVDIVSLYTNIPIDGALEAVKIIFSRFPSLGRPDSVILKLLHLILNNNDFSFNNELFLQKKGVSMGQQFAPSIANIYLTLWEQRIKDSFSNFPLHWYRYIDDIFFVWTNTEATLITFLNYLNIFDNNIKVTYDYSMQYSIFLDLYIFKHNNSLCHKVHFKETNSHSILHASSNHPKHTFRGIVYSQLRRWASLCSHRSDFDNACTNIFSIWRKRGYTKTLLRNAKNDCLNDLNLHHTWMHHFSSCNKCQFSKYLYQSNIFEVNNLTYSIIGNYNCLTNNVIYLIFCSNCKICYIGQTLNFHQRLYKHIENINNKSDVLLYKHFWSTCNIRFFKIIIIDHAKTTNKLKIKESNYIKKFNTRHPNGLNIIENFNKKTELILPFNNCSHKLASNIKNICLKNKIDINCVYKQGHSLSKILK